MKQILLCGQLFRSIDESVEQDMAVVLQDDRIVDILPMGQIDRSSPEVVDLSDKFVMPGLIDAHLHVNMDGKALPQSLFSMKTDGELTIISILNARANLLAGFTSIRDQGGAYFTEIAVKQAIDAGLLVGPRMMVSGMPLTATGGHADYRFAPHMSGENLGVVCNGPTEMMAAARKNLKYGADHIKLMATGGVMSLGNDPKWSDFTLEEMKAAIDIAKSKGKTTSAHAHGSDGIKLAVQAGITSIEHGMLMDDECIQLMADHGTYLVPTIIAAKGIAEGAKYGLPEWMVEKSIRVIQGHKENCRKCREAGIKVGFGSDAGTSYNFHGKQTIEFELMAEFGFSIPQVLLSATRVNAEMMGWNDRIGTLEVGKLADLVAFDQSPLENIQTVHSVSFVMKGGETIKKDGESMLLPC